MITYATRKSALALAQARAFVQTLGKLAPGQEFKELHVVTTGDRVQDRPLADVGGKGLFVKEIEEALLASQADFAVHSLKDVPPELAPGLAIGCVPKREDPRDVLITRSGKGLAELPAGSRVGTSSLRRRIQLLRQRPDLEIVVLRGNVDTRIRKCREGEVDAIVLARAGLVRLGRAEEATEVLAPELMLPAVGQGALAIELRSGDERTSQVLSLAHDEETGIAISAERGVMRAVEGNCQTPVAAFAERQGDRIRLRAMLAEPDGSNLRSDELSTSWPSASDAERLGLELGQKLKKS
ncbi:MAG TPA: hydroxymethylbilane synthase [Polyangiaceae bacterium]|nr:hydroxymethylbilane synthase [Polyangiaceae bacterium]